MLFLSMPDPEQDLLFFHDRYLLFWNRLAPTDSARVALRKAEAAGGANQASSLRGENKEGRAEKDSAEKIKGKPVRVMSRSIL
ncbi:hypothetical protein MASR2M79_12490 [Aminivibrio sp.]